MGTGSSPGTNQVSGPTNIAIGFTPGISNPARIHHQAAEDLGMVRTIPNANVIDPVDPTDFRAAVESAVDWPGLTYIRGHRGDTPRILDPEKFYFELGKTYSLREGSNIGIIATDQRTQRAIEVSTILLDYGIDHSLLHVPTIKPVNNKEIADFAFFHNQIVTIENHQIVSGLGSLVAEIVSDISGGPRVTRMGLQNIWAPGGTMNYIRHQLDLDAETPAEGIKELVK